MSSIDQQTSEERVNVIRSFVGASAAGRRVRVLAAGLGLLAAGGILLGWSSRSRQLVSPSSAQSPATLAVPLNPSAETTPNVQRAVSLLAGLPLMFEPNQGQANLNPADARVRFLARGPNFGLLLGSEGAILHSTTRGRSNTLRMKLAGSNPNATVAAADPLPGKSNYLLGNESSQWRRNVPQFARVRYEDIYPGINLVFYGNQGRLEYDFQVAPGADPSLAELEFDGAKQLGLKDGDLVIDGEDGGARLKAPMVYQVVAGRRQPVEGRFVLRGSNRVGFAIADYDRSRELVIDPLLIFSTYFGGTGDEHDSQVAVDGAGNIYLAGSTNSTNLPVTAGVYQSTLNSAANARNVYIAKITPPQGSTPATLDYVTYLGGSGIDYPVGLAVDASGDPFVAGTTTSTNFPHSSTPYQSVPFPGSTGTQHVFVTEMVVGGTALKYSSYLSGNGNDVATGMTIDAAGNIYVTGTTTSNNPGDGPAGIQFPASTIPQGLPFQPLPSTAPTQFFVTKVNTQAPTTGSITYSTYFGGGNFVAQLVATGGGIAVDTNGNIYFTGTTNFIYTGCAGCGTTDFPIKNAYQPCLNQAPPTVVTNPPQCTNSSTSNSDAFVAKLNPNGPTGTGQLQWSTYVGGSQNDSGAGVAIDSGAANVYITGTTNSTDVTTITTFGAFQPCLDGPLVLPPTACPTGVTANDAFVARLSNPATTTTTNVALTYFSYLGGTGNEAGLAIAVDAASGAIVTGWTQSSDFPAYPVNSNDIQGVSGGGQDAFVARLNTAAATGQNQTGSWASYFGGSGTDQGTGIAIGVNQNVYLAGDTNSTDLHVTGLNLNNAGGYDAFVGQVTPASSLFISGTLSLGTNQAYIAAGSQATFTYTLTNNGPDVAYNITFTDNISQTTTIVPVTFVSAATTSGTCSGGSTSTNITCSIQSLQSGSTATITVVLTPTPTSTGTSASFNGGAVVATAANNITSAPIQVAATMSDFTVSVSPNSVSVPLAGDSAKYQVLVTPHPVFSTGLSFSCSNLPTGSACSFSPPTVQIVGSSPASTTLTISTTARPITTAASSLLRRFYAVWLCVPGLALVGLGADRRRRRIAGVLLLGFLSLLIVLQPACSHSATQTPVSGTPAGTYPITVTASATNDTKSQGVTLVVP